MRQAEVSKYKPNKIVLGVALLLGIIATLFPPFEWNHTYEGEDYERWGDRRGGQTVYYTKHSNPIKAYDFLFSDNQNKFYSNITERSETFTRSIILHELLVEYLLIAFVAVLSHIIFFKSDKKKLASQNSTPFKQSTSEIKADKTIEEKPMDVKKIEDKISDVYPTQSEIYKGYKNLRSKNDG